MPFLSVIIPVYKVEKYLRQCVDSVLAQNLKDIEILLVDDGSPDQSPQICDEYAEKYPYIRVLHKENGGLSSARNAGIKAAQGDYLMFMDSDDWWNKDVDVKAMLECVKAKSQVEMFLFTSLDYIEGEGLFQRNEHQNLPEIKTDTVFHYYQSLLQNGNLEVSACTKILKTDFVLKEELFFKNGILSEDNEWMLRLLRVLKKVDILPEHLYLCRCGRLDSITHTIGKKNVKDLLDMVDESLAYYEQNPDSELKPLELCYAAYLWFCALGLSAKLKKEERRELKGSFQKSSTVCRYSTSRKTKLCQIVYRLVGLDMTTWILGKYISFKSSHVVNRKKVAEDF